ncbi:MAG: hypothetical protein QG662_1939 [Pseudomonadota bacterium]|nr:hypothetical protein [Pseudomonadota bacterium]
MGRPVVRDRDPSSSSANPLDRLFSIADSTPDRASGEWLKAGLFAYLNEPDGTLDRCLGVAGTLGRSPRFRWLKARRDSHLRAALLLLNGDYSALADEVARYDRAPRHARERPEPMADWSAARQEVHRAAQVGLALPRTRDGLMRTLTNEPPLFALDNPPETGDFTTNR